MGPPPQEDEVARTWQWAKNMRFAYAGSLKYCGQSGRLSTFFLAAFQNGADERHKRKVRKSLVVRARLRRSRGCIKENTWCINVKDKLHQLIMLVNPRLPTMQGAYI